jgi:hypothetical protein
MKHNTLAAALEYAELGYRVLPLKPGTKVPDLRHWPEEATTDPGAIRRHFALAARRGGGDPNVGIVTGSGLAVVDIDTYHGGEIPAWLDTERIDYDLLVPEDQKRDFTGLRRTFEYRDEVPVGERNNYLTSLAGYLFAQGESYSEVLSQLRTEVESLSFSPRDGEVESIVRSISRYH